MLNLVVHKVITKLKWVKKLNFIYEPKYSYTTLTSEIYLQGIHKY
jgi:hypothetical protein